MSAQRGPVLFQLLDRARHEPARIDDLLESHDVQQYLAPLSEGAQNQQIHSTLLTMLAEPIYFRVFADAISPLSQQSRYSLPDTDDVYGSELVTPILYPRLHKDTLRDDQIAFLTSTNGAFDAAMKDIYRNPDQPAIESPEHPYNPIWQAFSRVAHRNADSEKEPEYWITTMPRQQFFNTLFAIERIIGPWGKMSPADIKKGDAPQISSAFDLSGAVLNNLPLVTQLTRMDRLFLDAIVTGMVSGAQPVEGEPISRPYGSRGLIAAGSEDPAKVIATAAMVERVAEAERAWKQRQAEDFSGSLAVIETWMPYGESALPRIKLTEMPTHQARLAGTIVTDHQGHDGLGKGRCPAPESVTVPAALELVGPQGPWATEMLDTYRVVQQRGDLPRAGAPTKPSRTSLTELITVIGAGAVPTLVKDRTTGTGMKLGREQPWQSLHQGQSLQQPRRTASQMPTPSCPHQTQRPSR